jgi:hypothetical protein
LGDFPTNSSGHPDANYNQVPTSNLEHTDRGADVVEATQFKLVKILNFAA